MFRGLYLPFNVSESDISVVYYKDRGDEYGQDVKRNEH